MLLYPLKRWTCDFLLWHPCVYSFITFRPCGRRRCASNCHDKLHIRKEVLLLETSNYLSEEWLLIKSRTAFYLWCGPLKQKCKIKFLFWQCFYNLDTLLHFKSGNSTWVDKSWKKFDSHGIIPWYVIFFPVSSCNLIFKLEGQSFSYQKYTRLIYLWVFSQWRIWIILLSFQHYNRNTYRLVNNEI